LLMLNGRRICRSWLSTSVLRPMVPKVVLVRSGSRGFCYICFIFNLAIGVSFSSCHVPFSKSDSSILSMNIVTFQSSSCLPSAGFNKLRHFGESSAFTQQGDFHTLLREQPSFVSPQGLGRVNLCRACLRHRRTIPSLVVLAVYTADVQLDQSTTTLPSVDCIVFTSYLFANSPASAWAPRVLLCFQVPERPLLIFLNVLRPLLRQLLSSRSNNPQGK
jgi:hypothetical protein